MRRVISLPRRCTTLVTACLVVSSTAFAATSLWWDTNYALRFNIDVAVGANTPDKGYAGYTARIISLDTQALIGAGEMLADCSDLRITYYDGLAWQELSRHVLNCNTPSTDVRFMLAADIPAGSNDDNYYLYYNNPSPAAVLPEQRPTYTSGMTTHRLIGLASTFAGALTPGTEVAGITRWVGMPRATIPTIPATILRAAIGELSTNGTSTLRPSGTTPAAID